MTSPYNGFGAIPGVMARTARAPMRYRTLVPWVVAWAGPWMRLAYWLVRALFLIASLVLAEVLFGIGLPLACLVATTFQFDYWDQYVELFGVLCCLSGVWWLIAIGCVFWGMSRETIIFAPMVVLLASGIDPIVGCTLLGLWAWVLVRVNQGKAEMYCKRFALLEYNWTDFQVIWKCKDMALAFGLVWIVAAIVAIWFVPDGVLRNTAWAVGAWLLAGVLFGRVREVRIFLPTAIWMAAAFGGGG